MSVLLRLNNVFSTIEGDLPKAAVDELRSAMSFVVPGHKFMARYKQDQILAKFQNRDPWDGTSTVAKWKGGNLVFPTGLFSYFREIMAKHGVPIAIRDERLPSILTHGLATPSLVLRDYQEPIVAAGLDRQRGVMKMATGGGKTEAVLALLVRASSFPAIFYVTSCDLLEQAYDRFSKHVQYNGVPAKIGRIGAGHCDIQSITIATVQSCQMAIEGHYSKPDFDDCSFDDKTELDDGQKEQIKQLVADAQFVYVDECQHVSCETIQSILNRSHKARFRIGGSASPWRDDGLDILIEAAFGRRFCDISASFLINSGWLVRPYITFNHFNQALGPTGNFQSHYSTYIVHNEARNKWIAEATKKYLERNLSTIILVKQVQHAEILADLVGSRVEILTSSGDPKKSPKKRKEVLDRLRSKDLLCVIGTSLLDEGVDVPAASVGIFAGGGKSSTRELQRVGRVIRPDPLDPSKKCAYIEEFWDHTKYLNHHAKTRRRILDTEPEFNISDNRDTSIL